MVEINNKTRTQIDLKLVKKTAEKVLVFFKKEHHELSIGFIGDRKMSALNLRFRGKNKPTDVLSFSGEGEDLGEILLDYQQISRQAKKYGNTAKQELIFILVHGLLHLIGYNDETEKDRLAMVKLGEDIIKKLKL
ncbi:MAG: putative rRNA maturation factor [Parcubacteria group bacterium GW2011_GWE2_39_37]|nr:MAG: putative rRNA maturation factor [Parcubacteria group bacterium GW2011_GWE2_39_37]